MTRIDIAEGWYWFCTDFHTGQGSKLYARLCRISMYYSPGAFQTGPEDNAEVVYKECVRKYFPRQFEAMYG